jgi:hypothetical protein
MTTDTRAYWSKQVKRWAASRLTLREYAAMTGVGASSLKSWKWKLGLEAKQAASGPGFVEVVGAMTPQVSDNFEVVLVDGVVVRVPSSFDGAALTKLLAVVGQAEA